MSFETEAHGRRNARSKGEYRSGESIFRAIRIIERSSLLILSNKGNLRLRGGIGPKMFPARAGRLVC
jgi:N-methylhydantoinase B/oxoprolinase/acetone carboxylase alpha subunit